MNQDDLIAAFDQLRVWQKNGRRAVHKPLLVLLMLGRLAAGNGNRVEFSEIDQSLHILLRKFGPPSSVASRHYPFWHLKTDGIWTLNGPKRILERPPGATPTLAELREHGVSGSFTSDIVETLEKAKQLIPTIARRIVEAHFPESIQQDVLDAVGIESSSSNLGVDRRSVNARRDPAFRTRVLSAYEYRCCICGHDLQLGGQVVGLEAAHIMWFQAGGPDIEQNGFAMCSLHHKLFDLGAFTIARDGALIVVSQHVGGSGDAHSRMTSYHAAGLIGPQSAKFKPKSKFLDWHWAEVFKNPARKF